MKSSTRSLDCTLTITPGSPKKSSSFTCLFFFSLSLKFLQRISLEERVVQLEKSLKTLDPDIHPLKSLV